MFRFLWAYICLVCLVASSHAQSKTANVEVHKTVAGNLDIKVTPILSTITATSDSIKFIVDPGTEQVQEPDEKKTARKDDASGQKNDANAAAKSDVTESGSGSGSDDQTMMAIKNSIAEYEEAVNEDIDNSKKDDDNKRKHKIAKNKHQKAKVSDGLKRTLNQTTSTAVGNSTVSNATNAASNSSSATTASNALGNNSTTNNTATSANLIEINNTVATFDTPNNLSYAITNETVKMFNSSLGNSSAVVMTRMLTNNTLANSTLEDPSIATNNPTLGGSTAVSNNSTIGNLNSTAESSKANSTTAAGNSTAKRTLKARSLMKKLKMKPTPTKIKTVDGVRKTADKKEEMHVKGKGGSLAINANLNKTTVNSLGRDLEIEIKNGKGGGKKKAKIAGAGKAVKVDKVTPKYDGKVKKVTEKKDGKAEKAAEKNDGKAKKSSTKTSGKSVNVKAVAEFTNKLEAMWSNEVAERKTEVHIIHDVTGLKKSKMFEKPAKRRHFKHGKK